MRRRISEFVVKRERSTDYESRITCTVNGEGEFRVSRSKKLRYFLREGKKRRKEYARW